MTTPLTKVLFCLFLFVSFNLFAQQGIISGVLKDDEGTPIPGANILIKGTSNGVTTDFDGNYRLACKVGDVLIFNFIGFSTKEVTVTSEMFGEKSNTISIEKTPVKPIKTNAYKEAIQNINKTAYTVPSMANPERTYNKKSHFEYNRIKNIEVKKDKVNLTYFNPDVYFEAGLKTITGFQFVKNNNLPQLQSIYSQGTSNNSQFIHQGPETGNIFSYGPKLSLLEFDGSNYSYDNNGRLVSVGNGNGLLAKTYKNSPFKTSINSTHNVFFNINTKYTFLRFDLTNKSQKDLYDVERSTSNNYLLKFENKLHGNKVLAWDAFIRFNDQINNQPNINGFQNNLLLNAWITPPSFSNAQGDRLQDNTQRSFSPNDYNNPKWLLKNNRNAEKHKLFIASLKNRIKLSDEIHFNTKLNFSNNRNFQKFGVVKNTNGFENGYLSDRTVERSNFNAAFNVDFEKKIERSSIKINSTSDFFYEDLKYNLFQADGFNVFSFANPALNSLNTKNLNRNTFKLHNKLTYKFNHDDLIIGLTNNSYISSIQNNKWWLPTLQIKWNLDNIIDIYNFYSIYISSSTSFDINDTPLLYSNQSHNSLNIRPEESLSYKAINDLFIDNTLKLEEKESYDINFGFSFTAINTRFNFGFTHFSTKSKNTIYPIYENNAFQLKNVADVTNSGVEIDLSAHVRFSNNFTYQPTLTFSTYRPKVSKLLTDKDQIPIAGFSTVSKNLIVGQPTGVIVGSAFARDYNNELIIGNDGFPIVASEPKIIGNPIPKFNLGFNNYIELHGFTLNFLIDFQKGGDVWNGTQNVLNYFGTSHQSATQRNINNFVYDGVTQQGEVNTLPVSFYNPENSVSENRFVRYGFEGVAEEAILDGSYVNLKSLDLTYTFKKPSSKRFIRSFDIGLYTHNLITFTKFKGATPYSNLYNNSSASGLNFFNAPLISEIGLKINLKI